MIRIKEKPSRKFKNTRKYKDLIEIYGFHSVLAALENNLRKHEKLVISSNIQNILSENTKKKVNKIVTISSKDFNKIYGKEYSHQGIVLKTTNLVQPKIEDIILKYQNNHKDVVVMLDQVTDPNNIGSIMRSCSLFNCHSIILSKKNAPDITPAMTKSASGAVEIVNYIKVTNLIRTIDKFKKNNYWVVGFDNNSNKLINNVEIPKKCLLIFGSEGKGLRNLTIKKCDNLLKIPMNHIPNFKIESLNIANACTIGLYEHFKIRK